MPKKTAAQLNHALKSLSVDELVNILQAHTDPCVRAVLDHLPSPPPRLALINGILDLCNRLDNYDLIDVYDVPVVNYLPSAPGNRFWMMGVLFILAIFIGLVMLGVWLAWPDNLATPIAKESAAFTADAEPSIPPTLAQIGDTWTRPADGMVMVYVPPGEFLMGSAESDVDAGAHEKPQHTVFLDAYWIDRTEVTNAMFRRFSDSTGYTWDGSFVDGDDHPVVLVSWNDSAAYCIWAGGKLPSEAQWEKAARGMYGYTYPWGKNFDANSLNFCDKNCFYDRADKTADDGWGNTAPVGSFPSGASPYDVLDMSGNVWEWVADWYDSSYYAYSPFNNPTGPASGELRVLRGGAWDSISADVRTVFRFMYKPTYRDDYIGFRCVR